MRQGQNPSTPVIPRLPVGPPAAPLYWVEDADDPGTYVLSATPSGEMAVFAESVELGTYELTTEPGVAAQARMVLLGTTGRVV